MTANHHQNNCLAIVAREMFFRATDCLIADFPNWLRCADDCSYSSRQFSVAMRMFSRGER